MNTRTQTYIDAVLASNIPNSTQLDMIKSFRNFDSMAVQAKMLQVLTIALLRKTGQLEIPIDEWDSIATQVISESVTPVIRHDKDSGLVVACLK